ncbi:MAG: RNase adapter RapZ [Lachnospiraceae bacterium]|nr:RNase adapter RapZ [Lachnospiraceae bacterium]MCI7596388.1 RNase adapter RapZ [Lachnospiraceae bacterium]MDD7051714.1 RNase adapter RapZ [Lachnospiraceae bacterium]MDY3222695.1 RNase adapter RapZ [Lachnospiraceae bacterium]MDY4095356.1 RNase adapter RapZ [Lachnospiraceae bacterium]
MRFVVVTGMSGGGKSTALKMLEDMGYYCVDNLPVPLIEKFAELIETPNTELEKVALGLDVRGGMDFAHSEQVLDRLRQEGYTFEILFMDANDATLLKRYKETRRVHPLATEEDFRIESGVRKEREILSSIKKKADYVIDTSKLLTRELKEELDRIFIRNEEFNSLMVNIVSFGFKNGIPADADLVFDVRFLPNPFYIDELKHITGNDRAVQNYVMSFAEAGIFLDKLVDMLKFLLPGYIKEGKYQLVVAIGCTGGQHRSVTLANALYQAMKDKGNYGLSLSHRDIKE